VQFGVAYTWSKARGLTDQDNGFLPMFRDYRPYLYGKLGFDQTAVGAHQSSWTRLRKIFSRPVKYNNTINPTNGISDNRFEFSPKT
jgi:hypothetical protein